MADPEVTTIGVIFKRRVSTGPDVYTAIEGVFNITPPSQMTEEIEVTDLDDLAKRFKTGLRDNGEVTLQYNWIPAATQQTALRADFQANTLNSYKIEYPNAAGTPSAGGSDVFEGYVKALPRDSIQVAGRMTRTATIKVSGVVTET